MRIHKITAWLATDKDGEQFVFPVKPTKGTSVWMCYVDSSIYSLGQGKFKQTFNDEPRKIELTVKDF